MQGFSCSFCKAKKRHLQRLQPLFTLLNPPTADRRGSNLKGFKDVCSKNGSSQGQNLALTFLFIPTSLDSGPQTLNDAHPFSTHRRRWSSNPSGKCSYERPTRNTVCGTMRSMCGADAGCLAINYQSLPTHPSLLW